MWELMKTKENGAKTLFDLQIYNDFTRSFTPQ